MSKAYFLPHNDPGKRKWLKNFAGSDPVGTYTRISGLDPLAELTVEAA